MIDAVAPCAMEIGSFIGDRRSHQPDGRLVANSIANEISVTNHLKQKNPLASGKGNVEGALRHAAHDIGSQKTLGTFQ